MTRRALYELMGPPTDRRRHPAIWRSTYHAFVASFAAQDLVGRLEVHETGVASRRKPEIECEATRVR